MIPNFQQIATMSFERCRQERTRLKNEISFARGNALWGGPSAEDQIVRYQHAIEMIEQRLHKLEQPPDCAGEELPDPGRRAASDERHGWWEDTTSFGL